MSSPREVFIIAGPNGSGKTTFAVNLIDNGWIEHFVNADEIAKEYKNLGEQSADIKASREFLKTIDALEKGMNHLPFKQHYLGSLI